MAIQAAKNPGSSVTVGTGSTEVAVADSKRSILTLTNDSNEVMYLSLGGTAVANSGLRLNASGGSATIGYYLGAIDAICASGDKNMCIAEE